MVGKKFRVSINANKEKANQKSKTLNSSTKNHSRNYSNRQNKESAKSVLTVSSDMLNGLHEQHLNQPKNVLIGHLNISYIRNNFSGFKDLVLKETDICLFSETKIYYSFPNSQFFAEGYKMFRKDRNKNGGGLILNINEGIPSKLIN